MCRPAYIGRLKAQGLHDGYVPCGSRGDILAAGAVARADTAIAAAGGESMIHTEDNCQVCVTGREEAWAARREAAVRKGPWETRKEIWKAAREAWEKLRAEHNAAIAAAEGE